MRPENTLTSEMHRAIQICLDCHAICVETKAHCLAMGEEHASAEHIGLLADCAQICAVSADFMLRGSHRHTRTCAVCAEVCEECADDCDRLAGGDRLMKRCAAVCRRCAEACLQMAGAHASWRG